jgi:hypothetical protein
LKEIRKGEGQKVFRGDESGLKALIQVDDGSAPDRRPALLRIPVITASPAKLAALEHGRADQPKGCDRNNLRPTQRSIPFSTLCSSRG